MDILQQLLVCFGAFALIVVVGTFIGIMTTTVLDMIDEREQARERDKE